MSSMYLKQVGATCRIMHLIPGHRGVGRVASIRCNLCRGRLARQGQVYRSGPLLVHEWTATPAPLFSVASLSWEPCSPGQSLLGAMLS
jgi:hypothetical protein